MTVNFGIFSKLKHVHIVVVNLSLSVAAYTVMDMAIFNISCLEHKTSIYQPSVNEGIMHNYPLPEITCIYHTLALVKKMQGELHNAVFRNFFKGKSC